MNGQHDLERRIADFYASEAPHRAPDWVLESTLSTIETTRQRRGLMSVPWRLNEMNGFAKLAVAAVIVVAAGIAGLAVLRPGSAPGPGGPPPSESPTPSPTRSLPPLPTPATPSPYVPPELSETFTSDIHGISLSYPTGWDTQPASASWTSAGTILFRDPAGDFMWDPMKTDHLFLEVGSRPLGGASLQEFADGVVGADDCSGTSEPIVVDGTDGLLVADCGLAFAASGGRGYLIMFYMSGDDADLRAFDYRPFFEEILATVQLDPDAAVDAAPSSSP